MSFLVSEHLFVDNTEVTKVFEQRSGISIAGICNENSDQR